MASFQQKFFPDIYARTEAQVSDTDPYCKVRSPWLGISARGRLQRCQP